MIPSNNNKKQLACGQVHLVFVHSAHWPYNVPFNDHIFESHSYYCSTFLQMMLKFKMC